MFGGSIDNDAKQMWGVALRYSAVGLEMGVAIAVGYLLGAWLDGKFDTKPALGLGGMLLGIVTAFRALYRVAKEMKHDDEKSEVNEGDSEDEHK